MKLKKLKTGYIILIFSWLLAGLASTAHATTLTPASGTTLAAADYNYAYTSATLTAGGGVGMFPIYTWTATGLPAGLNLNTSGGQHATSTITGTPTATGTFTITVSVRDNRGNSVTNTYYLTVNPALALTPANNSTVSPRAVRNVAYTSTTIFTASGGTLPYTWTTPTALPAGLSLSSTSGNNITITGTDTAFAGTYTFRVRVTDSNGASVTNTYTITIIFTGCDFTGGDNTASISFGNIDPTAGAGTIYGTITSGVQFVCTANTACTITAAPASGWQLSSGSNNISYTLGIAPGGTYGTTAVNLFPANSSNMTQGQYVNAPAGSYSNAAAITVTIGWATGGGGSIVATLPIGSVNGTVPNVCSVTGSPALAFGTLDAATNAGGATAAVTPPSIMCTMGDLVSVSNDGGLNYSGTPRMKSGTNYINYNFSSAGSLTGAGGTTNIGGSGTGYLNMGATIPAGALDNVPAGGYNDTVTLTISY